MSQYIFRRILTSLFMLFVVSLLVFFILRVLPGDPTISRFGQVDNVSADAIADLRRSLGLDDPIALQYLAWLGAMFHWDFGYSYFSGYSVTLLLAQRLPATIELAVGGTLIAVVMAIVLGVAPVMSRSRTVSGFVDSFIVYGISAPAFITGIILILVLSIVLGWLPATGYVSFADDPGGGLAHLIMPALALGVAMGAPLTRYLRGAIDDAVSETYTRTAMGKGLTWVRVIGRHVLPNASLPALTSLGVFVGSLLGGVVVVEVVFAWPGMGQQVINAVMKRDYPVIQATVMLAAVAYVLTTLLVDIAYGVLDPRLRVTAKRASKVGE